MTSTPDPLLGRTLRAYEIQEPVGVSRWGKVYRAFQASMHRTVAVRVLAPDLAVLPGKVEHFLEESRAEAALVHPHLVAVYEAGQVEGIYFCAMEFMDGPALLEFLRRGDGVDEHRLLQALSGVARALDFLWQRNVPHQPPIERNVLTTTAGDVKLINIDPDEMQPSQSPHEDVMNLAVMVATLANQIAPVSKPVSEFVERMLGTEGRKPFTGLIEVAEAAVALDRKLFPPVPSAKPALAKVEPKRAKPLTVAGMVVLVLALAGVAGWFWWRTLSTFQPPSRPADVGTMVRIPAGEFAYQDGQKKQLPEFFIDKYEVTLGEYKQFLDAFEAGTAKFTVHPFTPGNKNYRPSQWELILSAIAGGSVVGHQYITWDTPVFAIDWYDACAYASWRGKRLPREEWEKAARGNEGRKFPWGDAFEILKCNTSQYPKQPKRSEVYAYPDDVSAFGVIGLAGNVSEWTASTPDKFTAVIRGGSWDEGEVPVTRRLADRPREFRAPNLGFRCVADKEVH